MLDLIKEYMKLKDDIARLSDRKKEIEKEIKQFGDMKVGNYSIKNSKYSTYTYDAYKVEKYLQFKIGVDEAANALAKHKCFTISNSALTELFKELDKSVVEGIKKHCAETKEQERLTIKEEFPKI